MKKTLLILSAIALILAAVGCKNAAGPTPTPSNPTKFTGTWNNNDDPSFIKQLIIGDKNGSWSVTYVIAGVPTETFQGITTYIDETNAKFTIKKILNSPGNWIDWPEADKGTPDFAVTYTAPTAGGAATLSATLTTMQATMLARTYTK